jgi:hypothetical protein
MLFENVWGRVGIPFELGTRWRWEKSLKLLPLFPLYLLDRRLRGSQSQPGSFVEEKHLVLARNRTLARYYSDRRPSRLCTSGGSYAFPILRAQHPLKALHVWSISWSLITWTVTSASSFQSRSWKNSHHASHDLTHAVLPGLHLLASTSQRPKGHRNRNASLQDRDVFTLRGAEGLQFSKASCVIWLELLALSCSFWMVRTPISRHSFRRGFSGEEIYVQGCNCDTAHVYFGRM